MSLSTFIPSNTLTLQSLYLSNAWVNIFRGENIYCIGRWACLGVEWMKERTRTHKKLFFTEQRIWKIVVVIANEMHGDIAACFNLNNEPPKGEPIVFIKSLSSVRGLQGSTPLAAKKDEVHHEVELVVEIGETVSLNSSPGWKCVSRVGLGLDLTRRNKQKSLKDKGLPWTLAKNFEGATVLGPMVSIRDLNERLQPPYSDLEFALTVNGEEKQRGSLGQMMFPVDTLINFLASYQTLYEGDLIFTGTPSGVGAIHCGDCFVMKWTNGLDAEYSGSL
ncbi:hypothetical protein AAMO2058_000645500 [Amorphochlora amoebiformis]